MVVVVRWTAAVFALAALGLIVPANADPPALPGPPVIVILGQQFLPSGTFTSLRATPAQVLWTQQVARGEVILVKNMEPTFPSYQHTVTACVSPCRSLPPDQTPAASDAFDTGVIAYAGGEARIDTAPLGPGLYEYFCRPHPWMRGAVFVS